MDTPSLPVEAIITTTDSAQNTFASASTNQLEIELLKHLSKEIEMAQQQLIAQRSKNNLLVAFAPYLALGLLWANPILLAAFYKLERSTLQYFSVGYFIFYLLLGFLASQIEGKFWDQANQWRREIAHLVDYDAERLLFNSSKLSAVYAAIYGGSALGLLGLLWVIFLSR